MEIPVIDSFEYAKQAMASIEFFRKHYASGQQFQQHLTQITEILRGVAVNKFTSGDAYGDQKFLLSFADALEVANKAGPYVSLKDREA